MTTIPRPNMSAVVWQATIRRERSLRLNEIGGKLSGTVLSKQTAPMPDAAQCNDAAVSPQSCLYCGTADEADVD